MDDLVQFLCARLDEDERACSTNGEPGDWCDRSEGIHFESPRVLAEVDAKRQIVEDHGIIHRDIGWHDSSGDTQYEELPVCGLCVPKHKHYERREDVPLGGCRTVRLLALPYAEHPDYREEWRP